MSDHSSVLKWLDGLPPSSARPPDSRPSKRPAPQDFYILTDPHAPIAPALRRSSKRLKALQETSGNAMSLPQLPQPSNLNETPTIKPLATSGHQPTITVQPSRTPFGQAKKRRGRVSRKLSQEQEQDQSELDGDEQEEATPRPVKRSGRVLNKPILPRPSGDGDSTESSVDSSKSGASGKRGGSPVKKMSDLLMAEKPTRPYHIDAKIAREISGVLGKYKRLREISIGIGNFIQSTLDEEDWPPDFSYAPKANTAADKLKYERSLGVQIQFLWDSADECTIKGMTEVNWNNRVHSQLLQIVTRNPKFAGLVGWLNITDARIQPKSLSVAHVTGTALQSKMVDFAIHLNLSRPMEERVRSTISRFPSNAQSINQTMYDALRATPIAINMETKPPYTGGQSSDVQNAIWAGASLVKMEQILELRAKEDMKIPSMPLLTFHGHDMFFSAIVGTEEENGLYGKFRLGSSESFLGLFQIIAGLELLIEWANTDYRAWFESIFN